MRVQVYYNLHKKVWSVKDKKTGLVVDHCDEIYLQNCKFIVREGGRQRVIKEQRKNVHAFVEGDVIITDGKNIGDFFARLSYNPYKNKAFVTTTGVEIHTANTVKLKDKGVFI